MNALTEKQFEALAENAQSLLNEEAATGGIYVFDGRSPDAWMARISVVTAVQDCAAQVVAWGLGDTRNQTILGGVDYYANYYGAKHRDAVQGFIEQRLPDAKNVAVSRFDRKRCEKLLRPIIVEAKKLEALFRAELEV